MGRVLTAYARATIVTACLAAAVALTSCSDGADAQPSPSSAGSTSSASSSASSTSSPSSTTSSPAGTATVNVPAAARAHTEDGAKAFAKFYFERASRGAQVASSAELRSLSAPACVGCKSFIRLIDGYAAKQQHVDRDAMRVTDTNIRPRGTKGETGVDVLAVDGPKAIVDARGSTVRQFAESKLFFETTVEWNGNAWKMKRLQAVK